ncbi:hypothetical protein L2475_02415 [Lactobacillus gasseri]|nr:hypothetical protein [Lactobacillus gasseri]
MMNENELQTQLLNIPEEYRQAIFDYFRHSKMNFEQIIKLIDLFQMCFKSVDDIKAKTEEACDEFYEDQLDDAQSDYDMLESEYGNLEGELDDAYAEIEDLKTKIGDLKSENKALKIYINALEKLLEKRGIPIDVPDVTRPDCLPKNDTLHFYD